jgi:lipopolysaccharide exporter
MNPDFVRHLALSLLGASAARAISFAMLPLAARIYSKDDFGGLALALGFIGVVQPLLTLRYELAVVLARSSEAARAIYWGLSCIAFTSYLAVALLVIAAPDLFGAVVDAQLVWTLRAPVLLHLAAVTSSVILSAWLQRRRAFQVIVTAQFVGALMTAASVLGVPALVEPNLNVLVWSHAAGVSLSTAVLVIGNIQLGLFSSRPPGSAIRIVRVLKKYRVYPTYSLPLSLSSLFSDRAVLLYLSAAFSLSTLGAYFAVRQLLFGLVHLLTSSISQVVFSYGSRIPNGIASAKKPLLAMARGIAVTAGLALGCICVYSNELTLVLFGDRWIEVAEMMPWIAGHAAAVSVIGWQGRLLDIDRRQSLDAMLQISGDVALIGAIGLLWLLRVSPITAVASVSMVGAASAFVWITVAYRATKLGLGQALVCEAVLLASALGGAALALMSRAVLGLLSGLIISLAITGFGMLAAILITVRMIGRENPRMTF